MRVALVTETFPPEVNGVAMTLNRLVRGLAARGHAVQVVRPRQGAGDTAASDGVLEHVQLPGVPLPRYEGLRMGLPARGKILKRWRAQRPDVVHIATEGPLGVSALNAATKLNIPVSSSFHTNFHTYLGKHYGVGPLHGIAIRYLRYVHNRAKCTMVPSRDVIDALEAHGFRNLLVIARGVDTVLFSPAKRSEELRRSWGAGPDDPVVAYVGRLAAEKNLPVAVETFEAMRAANPAAKFVLVGDGPMGDVMRRKHPEYYYAGMRRGDDLAAHYASADVFVFPSITETFGNVVTEAMAAGLAVLTYDYAAGRTFIRTGENGVLAKFDDRAAFVEAGRRLIADRDTQRRLGAAARQTALGITWDAVIGQFEAKLIEVAWLRPTELKPQMHTDAHG